MGSQRPDGIIDTGAPDALASDEPGVGAETALTSPGDGSSAPGVSADSIRLGIGISDLGAIGALGPGYDQGEPREHIEAILTELRATGRLPVHGRDIDPLYSSYSVISADEQRATCETFGADNEVFAVMSLTFFGEGNECSAREFGLPTLTSDGQPAAVYERSWPNLFSLQMSADRLMRNFVAWADEDGHLTGERIGIYYDATPEVATLVKANVIAPMEARGHTIVAAVETSQSATGGPTDSVAVQQFISNRVTVAILLVSPIAKTNFFNQAETSRYRPLYLDNDLSSSTTDTATSTYPASHFDGALGWTAMRFGEANSDLPEPPEAQWCRAAIEKHTGNRIPRQGRDAEYISSNKSCDGIMTVLHGLEAAGRNLTRSRYIAGLESVRGKRAGIHGDISFSPVRHDGGGSWRRLAWSADCTCWRVRSPMGPLLVD